MHALFGTALLPTIEYMQWFLKSNDPVIDISEPWHKQSNRSRYHILSANGIQTLYVPLNHNNIYKNPVSQTKLIDFSFKRNHWRSIESAYNRSAFFEFYKTGFFNEFFFEEPYLYLFNLRLLNWILSQLKIDKPYTLSGPENNLQSASNNYHQLSSLKSNIPVFAESTFKTYNQVFSYKFGFVKNLSVIDLLFNCGPASLNYLIKQD